MGKTDDSISRYKRKLISSIVNSPELISLIDESYVVDGQCENADDLIYKNIFPYYYIPPTQTEMNAHVTMKVNEFKQQRNSMYKNAEVYIRVIAHQGIMEVKNGGGTRVDLMGEVVQSLFDGRDDFGFGKMELLSNVEEDVNTVYRCRVLRFWVEDFNADACRESI